MKLDTSVGRTLGTCKMRVMKFITRRSQLYRGVSILGLQEQARRKQSRSGPAVIQACHGAWSPWKILTEMTEKWSGHGTASAGVYILTFTFWSASVIPLHTTLTDTHDGFRYGSITCLVTGKSHNLIHLIRRGVLRAIWWATRIRTCCSWKKIESHLAVKII